MTDDVTKRAAQFLLKGARMLQMACPICHEPIYQLKDSTMICVRCDRKVEYASSYDGEQTAVNQQHLSQAQVNTDNPIQQKINLLSKQLQLETDPNKIIEIAEIIRKLENIMKS